MGVSGSGKSTIGEQLAERLGWPFFDGDAFHPAENIAKMSQGIPLGDDDRRPWLQAMHGKLIELQAQDQPAVLAASLLKQDYRNLVLTGLHDARLVYLKADPRLLDERLQQRQGHFFNPRLLASQLEILEEPTNAVVMSVDAPTASIVTQLVSELGLAGAS